MRIRQLERQEIRDLWSIDRAEVVENVFYREQGELVLRPEHHDIQGWPAGESEHYGPLLLDCFARGGTFYGAFDAALFALEPEDIHLEFDIPPGLPLRAGADRG